MKKITAALMVLGIVFGATTVSFAQTTTNTGTRPRNINHRQRYQQRRIAEGIENGSLTPREASRLERQETRINARERADRADGNFTRQERRQVNRSLNRESRRIYRQKHDAQHGY